MSADLFMPPVIEQALQAGAALAISVSGGADSQALAIALAAEQRKHKWPGAIFLIHAHLGRAEWRETLPHVERISHETGLNLVVVRRPKGDMVARWQERQRQLEGTGKPFWSSAQQRYCTADLKREPIDHALRGFSLVISAEGIRAQESSNRAAKHPLMVRSRITAKRLRDLDPETAWSNWQTPDQPGLWQDFDLLPGEEEEQECGRLAFTWYPLFHWSREEIWHQCGSSTEALEQCRVLYQLGQVEKTLALWPCHPCYVYGQSRCSCALCVLASRHDLEVGARHNPELLQTLAAMEQVSNCSFKKDLWLSDYLGPEQM